MFNEPRRNHPTLILERVAYFLFALAAVIFNALATSTQEGKSIYSLAYWKTLLEALTAGDFRALLSGAGLAVVLVVLILLSVFRWSRTFFHITDGVLYTERRTLFHKLSRLPVENITTINLERNVFEKLCGTTKVKIDINSATTANKTDFTFVLKDSTAQLLKETLTALRSEKRTDSAPRPALPRTRIASFSNADAVRHKLLSVPFVQILTALAVLGTFFQDTAMGGSGREDLVGLILLPLGLYLASLFVGIVNLCGFTLEGDAENLYINHGLLHAQSYTFERRRIKAVFIKQSLLARLAGLYSVELAVVGLGNEKNESPRLCLLVKKAEMERILELAVPAFRTNAPVQHSEKLALLPGFLKTAACTALTAISIAFAPTAGVLCTAGVLILGILASFLSRRTRTLTADDKIFGCSAGILNKKTGFFLYADLQEVRFKTLRCMKKGRVGRISFSILSAQATAAQRTGWFDSTVYEQLAKRTVAAPDRSAL